MVVECIGMVLSALLVRRYDSNCGGVRNGHLQNGKHGMVIELLIHSISVHALCAKHEAS